MLEPIVEKLMTWWEGLLWMLPNIAVAIVIVVVFAMIARLLARAAGRAMDRWSSHATLRQLVVTSVRVAVIAVGLFIALGILELDKTVTSLLAGVGVVGLALGFAFQDIAANFMSGVIMGLRKPLRVGDLVEVQGVIGTVRELDLRATGIETFTGQLVYVPNKDVLQSVLTNYTTLGRRRVDLEVGVAYDSELGEVEAVARRALEGLAERSGDEPVAIYFTGFGGSSIDLVCHLWIDLERQQSFLIARSEAIKAIQREFAAAGITIPFPIRTLDFGADVVGGKTLASVAPEAASRAANVGKGSLEAS